MSSLPPSPALSSSPSPAPSDSRAFSFLTLGARVHEEARAVWTLAIVGLLFAVMAANLLCLSPRWYSNSFIALVYEPARFVVLTAAFGGSAVWVAWYLFNERPSASLASIVLSLSTGWVWLPGYVLLYERDSPWMLAVVALAALGMAFGLRRLLPAVAPPVALTDTQFAALPSLNGLPPRDSPLLLASWIAILLQASAVLAGAGSLSLAALPLSLSVFLFAWRWSAFEARAAQWWTGRHPPLRQAILATLLTAMTLIPFEAGHRFGFLVPRHPAPATPAKERPADKDASSSGYYGIILYPPPAKKQIVAPSPHPDPFSSRLSRPLMIPFDGPYWYLKAPARRPGARAHIAHGKSTDVNVRSTDLNPLLMEAHQMLGRPIDLSSCGEIDLALTNADTRSGEISLMLLVGDAAVPVKYQFIGELPILSSQADPIPANRAPVKETLRFAVPRSIGLKQFNEITIAFQLSPRHARAGAKVSIDSFQLLPKP